MKKIKRSIKNYLKFLKLRLSSFHCKINSSPVFILGNQKSGTTIITYLLAESSGLSSQLDIPETWWPNLKELLVRNLPLEKFVKKNKHRFNKDIIKEPNLTFFYSELKIIFPKAKFVFVLRDPRDNVRSFLNRMKLPGDKQKLDLQSEFVDPKWKPVFDTKLWDIKENQYVGILASRWNKIIDVYLNNSNEIILFKYEDFMNNKIESIEDLVKKIGYKCKNDISNKINTQFQSKGDRNIGWIDFFGKENLALIENICSSRMKKFGYFKNLDN